jgi:type II secretory pathway predicted ATPase ExeA
MSANPYAPGAGTAPPVLVGRELQLSIIDSIAQLVEAGRRPQHTVLTGLRGVGKTVLLKEAIRRLRDRSWLCGYYEVRRDVEVGVAVSSIVLEGSRLLPAKAKLKTALRNLRTSIGSAQLSGSADGTLSLQVTRRESNSDPYLEALQLFRTLGMAAGGDNAGVALCVDEAQTFRRKDATTLLQALEADETEDSRVLLLAAGLPTTPVELSKARTYAERFRYEPLDDLTDADARRAVGEAAAQEGVTWDAGALERIVELANGYPFFLQLYASETWEVAAATASTLRQIGPEHLTAAEPRVARRLDNGLYATRYERSSEAERQYLHAVAELMGDHDRIVRSGDVAQALGKSLSDLSSIRDRLIRKGVIHAPNVGVLSFSVPGFRDYVARRDAGER